MRASLTACIAVAAVIALLTACSPQSRDEVVSTNDALALEALGYVDRTPIRIGDEHKSGVTIYDRERASPGLNLFLSEGSAGADLLDMEGHSVFRIDDPRPDPEPWKLLEPWGASRLLVLLERNSILVMDWQSRIFGSKDLPVHHDLAVTADGEIAVLLNRKVSDPRFSESELILDNTIAFLDNDGHLLREISFVQMVLARKELLAAALNQDPHRYIYGRDAWDVFHSNTIEVISGDHPAPFCPPNLLFCIRHLNVVGVIDPRREEIIWHWGLGELDFPHHPSLLDDGRVLIFDNGFTRGFSRVIELDPSSGRIEWQYQGDPPSTFFSPTRGAAQRLPNGNTLITESDRGRVFEVTLSGEIVWEFFNPGINREEGDRATIYRMTRFTDSKRYPDIEKFFER